MTDATAALPRRTRCRRVGNFGGVWWVEGRDDGGTTLRLRESGFRLETHRSGNDEGWTEELAELSELLTRD